MRRLYYSRGLTSNRRRGVAVVEFAVCLPVLVLLVLGAIQASSYIFLKQSLHAAAYESARHAIRTSATNASATEKCNDLLRARSVLKGSVSFKPSDIASATRGDRIEVSVTASTLNNTPLASVVIPPKSIVARVVMVKE